MCKTIKQKVKFKASPAAVYDVLADSKLRSTVTGRKADISRKVGGVFTSDDGRVTGVNVDLAPGKRIVQAWRRDDFPEGVYSMAAITLAPTPDGGTELVLTHRGVPKALIDGTEDDWREGYWAKIKAWIQRSG
jgi:uncharacterized protein YndB with AHSA1/START domain